MTQKRGWIILENYYKKIASSRDDWFYKSKDYFNFVVDNGNFYSLTEGRGNFFVDASKMFFSFLNYLI